MKLIVNSHAHWDHAGGIAALQRASGAVVAASASGALALRSGTHVADDLQYYGDAAVHVPKVGKVQVVRDGETVRVGPLGITAHMTPGHTSGSTSWSWRSCEQQRCMHVVYADSLNRSRATASISPARAPRRIFRRRSPPASPGWRRCSATSC